MKRMVFYETNKMLGFCPLNEWNRYSYDKELNPIRILVCEISSEAKEQIYELFDNDVDAFCDVVREELNENLYTLYMN